MPFLVLSRSGYSWTATNYRGTNRRLPTYAESLPEESRYNQYFLSYCELEGQDLVFSDEGRAREMLRLLRTDLGREDYELVEVVAAGGGPAGSGRPLGYDLSAGWGYSLLSWGLRLSEHSPLQPPAPLPPPVQTFCTLIEAYFAPLLNENGLLPTCEDADFCLRCMMAVQDLIPGAWESEEGSNFRVVGVHLLQTSDTTDDRPPIPKTG